MFLAGVGTAGATDSWDSFAGGLTGGLIGATVGNGFVKSQRFRNWKAGKVHNDLRTPGTRVPSDSKSRYDSNFQARIDEGYKTLSKTNWAKTERGSQVVKSLGGAMDRNEISIAALNVKTRADFFSRTGEIRINVTIKISEIPGRLAHEGTHLLQYQEGGIYGFSSEREAFNNAYAVDSELGVRNAVNPSDAWIRRAYIDEF